MPAEPIHKQMLSDGTTRYVATTDLPRGSDGRRRQRRTSHRTLREARQWLAKTRAEILQPAHVARSDITVSEYLANWLAARRALRPTTLRSYQHALAPITRAVGRLPLQNLTAQDIDALVKALASEPGPHGRVRRPRTPALMLSVLRHALRDAVRSGLLVRNVAELVEPPRQLRFETSTWTEAELRRFLAHVRHDRLYAAWMLSSRGLRRGEVLGLKWSNVDLGSSPAISVVETRVLVDGRQVVISEPKTARGRRRLPLDRDLAAALAQLKERQSAEAAVAGTAYEAHDLVVADELGRPVSPNRYSRTFRRLADRAGVRPIRLHDARHTALTLMTLNGVPLPVVSAWAGHADPAFTLRVYAHSQDQAMRDAAQAFGSLLADEV